MSQFHIDDLPNEIFYRIFHELPQQDLKAVVLVCKAWNEIGEDPSFWASAIVRIESGHDVQKLEIKRFQKLEIVEVNCTGGNRFEEGIKCNWTKFEMTELFKAIQEIPLIRRIVGKTCRKCISSVKPELLVNVLTSLEKVSVGGTGEFWCLGLGPEQLNLLFTVLDEKTYSLKLELYEYCDFSNISPGLFASAISNVAEVLLCSYALPHEKMEALLAAIAGGDRAMRKLKVPTVLTCSIDSDILANAFKRLEEVTIYADQLDINSQDLSAILSTLVEGESRLKRLMLHDIDAADIEGVDQGLIKRAVEKVGFTFSVYVYDDYGSDLDFSEDIDID